MKTQTMASFCLYALFYSFPIFLLLGVRTACSHESKDGLLRLEVKRASGSFEALVATDIRRWPFRRNLTLDNPLKQNGRTVGWQEFLLHNNARYKSVSLGGNVDPVGFYYIDLEIGGQKTSVLLETGSSNFIVPITGCSSCSPEGMIDISRSSSAQIVHCDSSLCTPHTCDSNLCLTGICSTTTDACCIETHGVSGCFFAFTFFSGEALAGVYFTDIVQVAGISSNATIGGILTNSTDFPFITVPGRLGMAFKDDSCIPSCATPLFDELRKKNNLSNIFSLALAFEGGSLILGGIDSSLYSGEIHYVPLRHGAKSLLYDVHCNGIRIGGGDLIPTSAGATIQSGQNLLGLDSKYYKHLKEYFQTNYCNLPHVCSNSSSSDTIFSGGEGHCFLFFSSDIEKFPTISIELTSSFRINLEGKDYMLPLPRNNRASKSRATIAGDSRSSTFELGTYCFSIVEFPGLESSEGYSMILGNVVLVNHYIVFNRENYSVGFADLI